MKLKPAILTVLDRDDLKKIVEGLGLDGVDRRSADRMRRALSRSRRIGAEELLPCLRKSVLAAVCETMNVPSHGAKNDLLARLMSGHNDTNGTSGSRARSKMRRAATTHPAVVDQSVATTNGQPKLGTKLPKLTLAKLESLLFKACDILRGKVDASEYKKYIFGMLFLKRLSDQFEQDIAVLRAEYESKGMRADLIERQVANPTKYNFFVPPEARWDKIRHLKTSVGSGLNKALAAIEDANPNTLQDVLKGQINFNDKIGKNPMSDGKLVEFIQHFDEIPLANGDFEFPDLLGAAYEYLIKFFADSAGKKGGEFYTPAEVVRLLVQIIEPHEGMAIYDPTVGSGGMLIQSKGFVEETGGDSRNLFLAGQEDNGGTWAICKMNMILHGVNSSDIRQGDTLKEPQHLAPNGELRRFDRVIANPPFAQDAPKEKDVPKFKDRFPIFTSGKKADLMFVQHMVSVLKSEGRLATVMPLGVLFRGGAEKDCRKRFLSEGWLEAVIGLPPSLFYGTGIPACVLVMNKDGASERKSLLFINADREYREGKNQNSLRPEDIQKITHVYRNRLTVDKYSRVVTHEELEREDYNLNIHRYVDNSPPPEPHDVRAHLHGGIPVAEVETLSGYFANYAGVRELLFQPHDAKYLNFAAGMTGKDHIRALIESAPGKQAKHAAFHEALGQWWSEHVGGVVDLLGRRQHYEVRRQFISSLPGALVSQNVLDAHQVRGAAASFFDFPRKVGEYVDDKGKERDITTTIASDMKSVAASGWNPLLIPEDEILKSQFPEVLQQIEQDRTRIAELEAMFAAVNGEGEESEETDSDEAECSESGILSKEQVKLLKDEKKRFNGELKDARKMLKEIKKDLQRLERTGSDSDEIVERQRKANDLEERIATTERQGVEVYEQLVKHVELESELKTLKANIRAAERKKEELVEAARTKISDAEAKDLILARFRRVLDEQFDEYLRQYQRGLVIAVANLWGKYAVTTKTIIADRDREANQLNAFLKELGYE